MNKAFKISYFTKGPFLFILLFILYAMLLPFSPHTDLVLNLGATYFVIELSSLLWLFIAYALIFALLYWITGALIKLSKSLAMMHFSLGLVIFYLLLRMHSLSGLNQRYYASTPAENGTALANPKILLILALLGLFIYILNLILSRRKLKSTNGKNP